MAAALSRLAGDGMLRTSLASAGRHRVETRFSVQRMIAEYHDAYRRAASS
jgi:glycosyltransferase involved in cell wall biosynthesis